MAPKKKASEKMAESEKMDTVVGKSTGVEAEEEEEGEVKGNYASAEGMGDYNLVIRGEHAGVLKSRAPMMKYRTAMNKTAYVAGLENVGDHEVYKCTWNTKLISHEDVLAVLAGALGTRCTLHLAATNASQRYDCNGPKWGATLCEEDDPDSDLYERRLTEKVYNGGGMALVVSPMGKLRIKVSSEITLKKVDGEEFKAKICIDLEHDQAA